MMKQIVFDVCCVQTPVFSSSGILKFKQILSSVIGKIFDQVKIYSLVD